MNNELLIRKMELIYGLYSHPDVAKFIFNVLLNFEIQKETNDKCFSFAFGKPPSAGFGFGQNSLCGFSTSGSGFSTSGSGFSTSGSGFSTSGSGFSTSGSGFSTSGSVQNPGMEKNFNNFIENQKPQTNFTLGSSNTFTFGQNNRNDQVSESTNTSNEFDTSNTFDTSNSFGMNHFSNNFENLKNHLFYENFLYKNNIPQTNFFNFKILFGFDPITKDFIIADKNNIEINYSNYKNYKNKNMIWLEDQYIFDEIILKLPLIQKNEFCHNENVFEKIHYFLKGFEKFLIELFLPNKFSKKFNEILDKFLTLPVLLAFSNEFENTRFSYKFYLMKNKTIDLSFYQRYNDNKNYYLKYFPSNEKEIDHFLNSMNHNFNFLNYF